MDNIPVFTVIAKKHLVPIISSVIMIFESISLIFQLFSYDKNNNLYITLQSSGLLILYLLIIILSLAIVGHSVFVAFLDYRDRKNKVFKEDDKDNIDKYLTNFIASGESVAILSHDMSWISKDNEEMLKKKAKRKELLLFLPTETEEVNELQKLGADVRCFGEMISDTTHATIKSRMTIINWNKAFPKLSYPLKKNGLHINYEIGGGEPANQLALDLVQLLISISEDRKRGEK